ncbi:hypothetical protein P280DRAFT_523031 [Massarina eburnea CBS 473.64]|uniref:Uncharacterized protein n=1 Tax=Massarina eburnea CBS 473.64 TaxID=1395130 RepID=A0A6A6RK64_9PLEO|nr:hypothetical protein P280DRAFT_523031 [Massarina eburnea CBS 473.64]
MATTTSAPPNIRQRRPLAPHHPSSNPSLHTPSSSPSKPFFWDLHLTNWRHTRNTASPTLRLLMLIPEILFTALSIRVFATTQHLLVRVVDETWETLSRRARSPFSPFSVWSLGLGVLVICAWHGGLARLSCVAGDGLDGKGESESESESEGLGKERRKSGGKSWSRVMGTIVVPGYLVLSFLFYVVQVVGRVWTPVYIVTVAGNGSVPNA